MPDVYISRAGMENQELNDKFASTNIEEIKLTKSEHSMLCASADVIRKFIYPKQTLVSSQSIFKCENFDHSLN